jgi:hypothetical protein
VLTFLTTPEKSVQNWQKAIIADAERKLGRWLKSYKREFIASRRGFIALEMIHETIKAAEKDELDRLAHNKWEDGIPTWAEIP